ncbi:uncharacterized protein LOC126473184 [Schistocerca serialis cubense]|uniref:uncharacterized protein LOC126473184 n=1 Tax=Schistocerca serialis cubense TaxID=2023355 RepID=UPI00214E7D11|nr:uncharacterized protein LOC126473184 [Schistocerca serialis cubense]
MADPRRPTQALGALLLALLAAAHAHALPADVYDQRQSGRVNVHVRVADAALVAMLPHGTLSELMDEMYDEYEDPEDPVASDDDPPADSPPEAETTTTTSTTTTILQNSAATPAIGNATCSEAPASTTTTAAAVPSASTTTPASTASSSTPAKRRRRCRDGFYRNQAGRCVRLQFAQTSWSPGRQ